MVVTVRSLGLTGIRGYEVSVECFLSGGLPAFDVVESVREGQEIAIGRIGELPEPLSPQEIDRLCY